MVCETGVVSNITTRNLGISMDDKNFRAVPYFVLEVVATEPTYEDKFRAWVKENDVKKGDRFVITKGHWEESNETGCIARSGLYGTKGTIKRVSSEYRCFINAELDDGRPLTVPYYAIKIIKEPTYTERQEAWIEKHNLKAGDKVAVLRKAVSSENGWDTVWESRMDTFVGTVLQYEEALKAVGIVLRAPDGRRWAFPYFALGVVKE